MFSKYVKPTEVEIRTGIQKVREDKHAGGAVVHENGKPTVVAVESLLVILINGIGYFAISNGQKMDGRTYLGRKILL